MAVIRLESNETVNAMFAKLLHLDQLSLCQPPLYPLLLDDRHDHSCSCSTFECMGLDYLQKLWERRATESGSTDISLLPDSVNSV